MSDKQSKHDAALDLTEQALDAIDSGDDGKADALIDKAKRIDPSAPKEILNDLDEAAGGKA